MFCGSDVRMWGCEDGNVRALWGLVDSPAKRECSEKCVRGGFCPAHPWSPRGERDGQGKVTFLQIPFIALPKFFT